MLNGDSDEDEDLLDYVRLPEFESLTHNEKAVILKEGIDGLNKQFITLQDTKITNSETIKKLLDDINPILQEQANKFNTKKDPSIQKLIPILGRQALELSKNVTNKNANDPSLKSEVLLHMKDINRSDALLLHGFLSWLNSAQKLSKLDHTKYDLVQEAIIEKLYPKYYSLCNKSQYINDNMQTVKDRLTGLSDFIDKTMSEKIKENKKKEKQTERNEAKEKETKKKEVKQTREEKLLEEHKIKEQQRKQQAEDDKLLSSLGAEEPKTKSKAKSKKGPKPVAPTEEDKQNELLKSDVIGRIDTIDKKVSTNGKDLEKYLSNQGQTILQYISGDKSKVYDNEMNEAIPNINITLNDGRQESLRKAVTLDLFNHDNIYEIKNYKEYSINDKIIPIQESKLAGTGYFVPLYLSNGKLYNLELNYIDPTTGERSSKLILPENPNGRELHLIYRLSDGIYEFKPLQDKTKYVALQETHNMTKDGQKLYIFKSTTFQPCKDHHGNLSFNIAPYLRKINI